MYTLENHTNRKNRWSEIGLILWVVGYENKEQEGDSLAAMSGQEFYGSRAIIYIMGSSPGDPIVQDPCGRMVGTWMTQKDFIENDGVGGMR
ncbi:MAG: hypothetical protein LUC94_12095 [Clostridiales bacterium]|nr:hypothetical protein [Clostridiales bacterium]